MRRLALVGCAISMLFIYTAVLRAAPPVEKAKPAAAKAVKSKARAAPKAKVEKKQAAPKQKKAKAQTPVVVKMTLSGSFPEGPPAAGLFGELQSTLASTIDRLDDAAKDKDVAAVWLKIEDLSIGRAKLYELRAAIARLRKTKKPVYAELTTADTGAYLLASACDRVVMPPSGMLLLPGVRMEVTFYKGLMDKLGLRFDALKMGKFKGAAEPLVREKMSGPLRESLESVVDDNYRELIKAICRRPPDERLPGQNVYRPRAVLAQRRP